MLPKFHKSRTTSLALKLDINQLKNAKRAHSTVGSVEYLIYLASERAGHTRWR